jgi:hypothetical protein
MSDLTAQQEYPANDVMIAGVDAVMPLFAKTQAEGLKGVNEIVRKGSVN